MKSIVAVNTVIPTIDNHIEYRSDESLIDYDIILFDPNYPTWFLERIRFSGGGSTIDVDTGGRLLTYIKHWKREIQASLTAGKTVFVILDSLVEDSVAVGSRSPRKNERLYSSIPVSNFDVLPAPLRARNAKGRRCNLRDSRFENIYRCLEEHLEYRVIVDAPLQDIVFTTRDDNGTLGGILDLAEMEGNLVLLPFFDPPYDMEEDEEGDDQYTEKALQFSHALVTALIELDRILRSNSTETPKPKWIEEVELPKLVENLDEEAKSIEDEISKLEETRSSIARQRIELTAYQDLLFENGTRLEDAISKSLVLLGFEVENFREGDLEIDHVFSGPSGIRLIGEAEGKDKTAVSISKFRQLESNVLEDLDREEIDEPAKPVLFGNGFRLEAPESRKIQFTKKCLKNAKRSGAALVQTTDLYDAVIYILNNEQDEGFRIECQAAIENADGELVIFPKRSL